MPAKKNYSAWKIDASQFSAEWDDRQKLEFFASFAILAPSMHNTQPWRFSFQKDRAILSTDPSRHLPYSGDAINEPFISLGACLQTMVAVAAGFGAKLDSSFRLDGSGPSVTIKISGLVSSSANIPKAILERVSNRNLFETKPLPDTLIKSITYTTEIFNEKAVTVKVLTSASDIEFIAKKTEEATYRTFGDKEFRAELSQWVRNNLTKQLDGMPGFVQGIPTPPSLLAKNLIRKVNIAKSQAKKDSKRVINSGNLAIICVKGLSRPTMLAAGRTYAQICISTQAAGYASSGIGTATYDQIANREIVDKFSLPGKPVAILRLGKALKPARHSPRRPLVTVRN